MIKTFFVVVSSPLIEDKDAVLVINTSEGGDIIYQKKLFETEDTFKIDLVVEENSVVHFRTRGFTSVNLDIPVSVRYKNPITVYLSTYNEPEGMYQSYKDYGTVSRTSRIVSSIKRFFK